MMISHSESSISEHTPSFDSLEELVTSAKIWKDEIDSGVRYKRLSADKLPAAVMNTFTKIMQILRKALSD